MGLFDFFRRSKRKAPASGPAAPLNGTIAQFTASDDLGSVACEGGQSLRFSRSACRGFEPVEGALVRVDEVSPHPLGGWEATAIALAMPVSAYKALVATRDQALSLANSPAGIAEKTVAIAHTLGWVVMLLDEAPPVDPHAFLEWATAKGLPAKGIRIDISRGDIRLRHGVHEAIAYVADEPFPKKTLDLLGLTTELRSGKGFITLSLGAPGMMRVHRSLADGKLDDPWEKNGTLRDLSRLVMGMLDLSHALVLPQAGAVMLSDTFRRRTGDLDDVAGRPFSAWVATAVDPELNIYATYGMVLHGLPDVEVPVALGDDWALDRSREALLFACQQMVFNNAPLKSGSTLKVPIGVSVGSYKSNGEGDAEVYQVQFTEGPGPQRLALKPLGDRFSTRALWQKASDPRAPNSDLIGLNTYRELVRNTACAALKASMVSGLSPDGPQLTTPFDLDVLRSNDDGGFFMMTNGLGRKRQPGGQAETGTAHVELVAAMGTHHTLLAGVLAQIGGQLHAHSGEEDHVYKAGDTIGFPVEELSTKGFVLRDAGRLQIADGAPVHLLEVIPLTHDEYQQVRSIGSRAWLEAQGSMSPARRAARWKLRLN